MSLMLCCVFITLDGPCTFVYDLFYSYFYVVIGCHSILEYMAGLHTDVSLVTSANRYYGLIEVYQVWTSGELWSEIQYLYMVRDMKLGVNISYRWI